MQSPFLLFLADVTDILSAKTAIGLVQWRRKDCIGQVRMPNCRVTAGLNDMAIPQAASLGAKTFVVGVTNAGGRISDAWHSYILEAIANGLDIASGMHDRLQNVDRFVAMAKTKGVSLLDLRHTDTRLPTGSGKKRAGNRLLTVGTDCSCGKKFTALTIAQEMRVQGINCTFRATGQTGIMISGAGIAIDALPADFMSGGAEMLSPENHPDHWDVIEGQASIFHPAFAGMSLALLHGSQPEAFVVCHEPTRVRKRGVQHGPPSVADVISVTKSMGQLTNAAIRCVGISIDTSRMEADPTSLMQELSDAHGVPVIDPIRDGAGAIVNHMLALGLFRKDR